MSVESGPATMSPTFSEPTTLSPKGTVEGLFKSELLPPPVDYKDVTAGLKFSIFLYRRFQRDAAEQLPWLKVKAGIKPEVKDKEVDRDLMTQHVAGLLDAYKYIDNPHDPSAAREVSSWGERGEYLQGRARHIKMDVEEKKNAILDDAQSYEPFDYKLAINEARKFAKQLPKGQREMFYKYAEIDPESIKNQLAKTGITGATFGVSTVAIDTFAGVAGLAAYGMNSLTNHAAEQLPTWSLGSMFAASYLYWGYEMKGNLKQNWAMMEQEGFSSNPLSQTFYEASVRKTNDEKKQRRSADMGYVVTELAKEIPWLTPFVMAATDNITTKEALLACIAANVGAGLYERSAAALTGTFLDRRRNAYNARFQEPSRKEII